MSSQISIEPISFGQAKCAEEAINLANMEKEETLLFLQEFCARKNGQAWLTFMVFGTQIRFQKKSDGRVVNQMGKTVSADDVADLFWFTISRPT